MFKNQPIDLNQTTDEYTYFLTSVQRVLVEKLHLCSWLFWDSKEYLEVGLQIKYNEHQKAGRSPVVLSLWIPWVCSTTKVDDMYPSLKDSQNCRFIFNEAVDGTGYFDDGNAATGARFSFNNMEDLCVLPIAKSVKVDRGRVDLTINVPDDKIVETDHSRDVKVGQHLYVRLLLEIPESHFSFKQKAISKTIYSYDVKVNEPRNHPNDEAFKLEQMCPIEKVYCFHIIPSKFCLSFLEEKAFQNVRILEKTRYENYVKPMKSLPSKIKKDEFLVVFNKRKASTFKKEDGTEIPNAEIKSQPVSFFSVFEVESVGHEQVVLALLLNLGCSLFFYFITAGQGGCPPTFKIWVALGVVSLVLAIVSWLLVRKQVGFFKFVGSCMAIAGVLGLLAWWVLP